MEIIKKLNTPAPLHSVLVYHTTFPGTPPSLIMATKPQPTEIRRNSRIAALDIVYYGDDEAGEDCSSSFMGLVEASQDHHECQADGIVSHSARHLDDAVHFDCDITATTALGQNDSPATADSTATRNMNHQSQKKHENIRKSLSRFLSSRGPRSCVREEKRPPDSSWREADGGSGREGKLDKLQEDLEEAQARIRNLMSQLGRGSHWWGSFLK